MPEAEAIKGLRETLPTWLLEPLNEPLTCRHPPTTIGRRSRRGVKSKRPILFVVLAVVVLAVFAALFLKPSPPPRLDATKIFAGAKAYARDQAGTGLPPAATVSLRTLITAGYLQAADVEALADMEVVVFLNVDRTDPSSVLLRAKLADGTEMVLLVDGTIKGK